MSAYAWEWPFFSRVEGSGRVVQQPREVSGYSGIDLELPAQVELVQGTREGVVLETDDNIAPHIEVVVANERLTIRAAKRSAALRPSRLKIVVQVRRLEHIGIAGSGSFQSESLQTPRLELDIAGSGVVSLRGLEADSLKVSIAGNGNVVAAGRADALRAHISGSGDIRAAQLAAKTATLNIAGSGNAALWVSQALDVSISGSGDVAYWGDATVTQSVAGAGNIKRMGSTPPK